MSTFQENLKKYRDRLGINAKDLAAQIGVKYTTYLNYENAGSEPKYDTLCKIAAALHVSIDDLLGYQVDRLSYWLEYLNKMGLLLKHERLKNRVVITIKSKDGIIAPFAIDIPVFLNFMENAAKQAEEKTAFDRDNIIKHHLLVGLLQALAINGDRHPKRKEILTAISEEYGPLLKISDIDISETPHTQESADESTDK